MAKRIRACLVRLGQVNRPSDHQHPQADLRTRAISMIDPADQQTQALPLDEQTEKKRRGRPATGKAMTPAEKQRAYRERQKRNVTETKDAKDLAYLLENLKRMLDMQTQREQSIALQGFAGVIMDMIRERE